MNNNLKCDIVRDLLELYYEKMVRDTTAEAVSEHLKECESCRKEYESLKKELPEVAEISTSKEFFKMMKRKRIIRMIAAVLVCVIACAGACYVLTSVNLSKIDDITVYRVYRYSANDGDKFFVLYSTKNMSQNSPSVEVTEKDGRSIFVFDRKRPIISKDSEEGHIAISCFSAQTVNVKGEMVSSGCDELVFGGQTVWTKEKNSKDEIPAYVYAYEEYENANQDEFGDSDTMSATVSVNTENLNDPNNSIGVQYPDGRVIEWNLDGEVIYDSSEKTKGSKE